MPLYLPCTDTIAGIFVLQAQKGLDEVIALCNSIAMTEAEKREALELADSAVLRAYDAGYYLAEGDGPLFFQHSDALRAARAALRKIIEEAE